MTTNFCPDCETGLQQQTKRCACGWVMQKVHLPEPPDYLCHHEDQGIRCTLLGTICLNPYSNGPWYCRNHWRK